MEYVKLFGLAACGLLFAYLCGAFVSASFDISQWQIVVRIFTVLFGSLVAAGLVASYIEIEGNK